MDIQQVTRTVESLRKKVATAEQDRARAEGSLQSIMDRLKNEFGCNTLDEANSKLIDLDLQIGEADTRIQDLVKELEEAMNANPA